MHTQTHAHYTRHTVTLLRSVYSHQTLSSQRVLHIYTSGDSIGASATAVCSVRESVSLYIQVDISILLCVYVCVYLWPSAVPATCVLRGWISLYRYRQWLAAHICVKVTRVWHSRLPVGETQRERERWNEREWRNEVKKPRKKARETNNQKNIFEKTFEYSWPTYTAGYGAVPLSQGIRNCQTFNGTRSLQHITWAALKADYSANSEVVTHTASISGLRDWAALGGTGSWHSFWRNRAILFDFKSLSVTFP